MLSQSCSLSRCSGDGHLCRLQRCCVCCVVGVPPSADTPLAPIARHQKAQRFRGRWICICFLAGRSTHKHHENTNLTSSLCSLWPAGGRGHARRGGRATGQHVGPIRHRRQRPAGHVGLVRYLGQPDRRTGAAALQHQIRKTDSTGTRMNG